MQAKAKRPETDIVGELVARGEAEVGVTAIATLIATSGIATRAAVPDIARSLIKFVTGPTAIPVIRSKGMEPW